MSDPIEFVRNYSDHSTDRGFQFEFHCDRCGSGFRTRFQPSVTGNISGALDAASSLFGGLFSQAADLGERVRSSGWQKAHDDAFQNAVLEIRPHFAQCPSCSSWVCRKTCWNDRRGLCKNCAPDLNVEMTVAQAAKASEAVIENAEASEEDLRQIKGSWKETKNAVCPQCHAPLDAAAKFCPECGTKIKKETFCPECGARLAPGTKFCTECGTKIA